MFFAISLSALLRRMDLIFIAFYDDNDLLFFCAGNLYFSNKKNKVMIYYCSRFCLRIDDQLRRRRGTDKLRRTVGICFCI